LLITDEHAPSGLVESITRALDAEHLAGVAVQLRAKSSSTRALCEAGEALRRVTRRAGVRLLVNGRVDVALAIGADGVHLPEGGLPPASVRSLLLNCSRGAGATLGASALVGASCHDAAGLARAAREGADYAVLGPIGDVPGKGAPLGIEGFRALVSGAGLPVLALGGVGVEGVPALLEAGAYGVAVIRSVSRSVDPARALSALTRALDTAIAGER
jgi:thiamine-phosphate pyrophosphorylase